MTPDESGRIGVRTASDLRRSDTAVSCGTVQNGGERPVKAEIAGSKPVGAHQLDDSSVRALYREPPERFIAARDSLVRELKESGRAESAASVKARRKPSVAAWAVNQLADRAEAGIEELLDAGAGVRAAQQAAMTSGANAQRLREATATRRQVLSRLVEQAGEVLRDAGRAPESHADAIRATLEAASVDSEAAELLRSGTLERTIQEVGGFGDVFGLQAVPDAEGPAEKQGRAASGPTSSKADADRLRRDAVAAERKARRARETADRLAEQVRATRERLEDLTAKQAAAESAALEAELEAKRASATQRTRAAGRRARTPSS
jgi:hypothetical protein